MQWCLEVIQRGIYAEKVMPDYFNVLTWNNFWSPGWIFVIYSYLQWDHAKVKFTCSVMFTHLANTGKSEKWSHELYLLLLLGWLRRDCISKTCSEKLLFWLIWYNCEARNIQKRAFWTDTDSEKSYNLAVFCCCCFDLFIYLFQLNRTKLWNLPRSR